MMPPPMEVEGMMLSSKFIKFKLLFFLSRGSCLHLPPTPRDEGGNG